VLPSLQYSAPSQVALGGRHIPSAHLRELFVRQPTGIAKEIMQYNYTSFALEHWLSAYKYRTNGAKSVGQKLQQLHQQQQTQSVPTSAVRNTASFKLNSGFCHHSAGSSGPPLLGNVTTVV